MKKIIICICFFMGMQLITACSSTGGKGDGAPDLIKAAAINVQLGARYLVQNKINLAKIKLEKALEQDSDNALAHSTMALLLENVGQHENIIEHYEEAVSLAPENSDIKNNFGTYLCNQSRFEEAQALFKEALNDPYYKTPVVALINAGKCAMSNSKYKMAESYLRKALRKDPKSVTALYSMAVLGLKSKRYLMTRAYIQRYHAIKKHTAKSLWLQIAAEQALGDKTVMHELIQIMNKKFPDSDEAGLAIGLMR